MRWLFALGCGLSVAACDAPAPPLDAPMETDAGTLAAITPPSWGACADGYTATDVEGAAVCAPPARVSCTGATFQPIDRAACEPIDPCGAGAYRAERLDDRAYVYVDASAPIGGDGSEAAPFRALDDALRSGATGVLLAAGDYEIHTALPADLDLRGVCTERSRLIAAAGGVSIFVPAGQRARLTGLTVTGTGIGPAARGALVFDRVLLEGLDGWGAGINGGTLEATRLVVRAPVPSTLSAAVGLGLSLIDGATATLRDVVVEEALGVGVQVEVASLDAERLVVQHIDPETSGMHGGGLSAVGGSTLVLRDALITDVHDFGIAVQSNSTATLDRVAIVGVAPSPADVSGKGLELRDSVGTFDRVYIEGATASGLHVMGSAMGHARDLVVRNIVPAENFGVGISVVGGSLELERAWVLDTTFIGVVTRGATITGNDLVVRRVSGTMDGGSALVSSDGGAASIERFEFTDLMAMGVLAVGVNATLSLSQGSIRRVSVSPENDLGRGAEAHAGGHLVLRSVILDDVVETAIVAFGGNPDGTITEGTIAELTDVHVSNIRERSCARTTCATEAGGTGVSALFGATITASELYVEGAPLCGVQVFDRASLDVTSGAIATSAIGACVQIEGYDLSRIVSGVRFVDNERNVETAGVYVPRRGPTF